MTTKDAAQRRQALHDSQPKCATCLHWRKTSMSVQPQGECWVAPPQGPLIVGPGQLAFASPVTKAEYGCAAHQDFESWLRLNRHDIPSSSLVIPDKVG